MAGHWQGIMAAGATGLGHAARDGVSDGLSGIFIDYPGTT